MPKILGVPRRHLVLECEKCETLLGFEEDEVTLHNEPCIIASETVTYECPICEETIVKSIYNAKGTIIWVDDVLYAQIQATVKEKVTTQKDELTSRQFHTFQPLASRIVLIRWEKDEKWLGMWKWKHPHEFPFTIPNTWTLEMVYDELKAVTGLSDKKITLRTHDNRVITKAGEILNREIYVIGFE